jgi:hypothetical protein
MVTLSPGWALSKSVAIDDHRSLTLVPLVTHQTLMEAVLPEADEADEVVEEDPQAAAKVATPTAATSSDQPLRGARSF